MSTKAKLKGIGGAIQASKFDEAAQEAQQLLAKDPNNYQGNLFLGFARDKQGKLSEAEAAYISATKIKPQDSQAWQGLIKLYEKQDSKKLSEYKTAATELSGIYARNDDAYKSQDVVDKFIGFAKSEGDRKQYRQSLEILLPTSAIYTHLEGRLPPPAHTYEKIAQITEVEEKERINKEIGERRTRLGARVNQVTLEVKREVFQGSPLEDLYEKIIEWTPDDELRRKYEEKLLQRCFDTLLVLPSQQKVEKRARAYKLANDMVIIKHPFKLAWDIALEWQDKELVAEWDVGILREYAFFFPGSGLGKILQGFLSSEVSPFPEQGSSIEIQASRNEDADEDSEDEDDNDGGGVRFDAPMSAEDRLLLMTDGISEASNSILAHRLMGEYYTSLEEHEYSVELARAGRQLVTLESQKIGLSFKSASLALTVLLGTSLVFYQSPKNHPEAKALFEGILSTDPQCTPAMIGIGLIYEEEEDYSAAADSLNRALHKDPNNIRVKSEAAWVAALLGDLAHGQDLLMGCAESIKDTDLRSRELKAQVQYRIGMCMWNIDPSTRARKDRSRAYAYFLAAIKSNLSYAPAYTSLGIFYSDYSKDKKRARKCFQKAFELSASEVVAAERLAQAFASDGEWDLVEVVAQRVADSGKLKPSPGSKKKGISWPYAALGIAELSKQDFAKSIVSFQSALRISPDDYHSWVGLGESYHHSGRYVAATKAFSHAETFENQVEQQKNGEVWFARYMLANVKRELGDFEGAIKGYRAVLGLRDGEVGISIALIQTLVESAWDSINKGLFGFASHLATEVIETSLQFITSTSGGFNLWRSLGDACAVFSYVQEKSSAFPHDNIKIAIQKGGTGDAYGVLAETDGVGTDIVLAAGLYSEDEQGGLDLTRILQSSILCHKRAIHAAANDLHAQAVAYYNLGWSEHRAHVCLTSKLDKKSTRYLKASVRCFKRAIELEAGNSEFWNALGVVTSETAPKIAQHAFVRSLFLNERSAQTWTNLGSLYLLQNDHQLANEAFTRAQSTDPDFAHAWLGQGIVALLFGEPKEARLLFAHSMELSDAASYSVKQHYAVSTFDHLLEVSASSPIEDLVLPIFALGQLNTMLPGDLPYRHLESLFLERINDISASISILDTICSKAEAEYEITESAISLSRFALARADLARSQLAAGSYDMAIENAETALELSAEDAGNEMSLETRRKCRLSAHLTLSLGYYYSNSADRSVEYLVEAIDESKGNPDCICMLAQVLWATGTKSSHVKARDQLFDCIENHPGHVQAVLLLGTISILDDDIGSIEAVTVDLQSLRMTDTINDEERGDISEVLRAIAALSQKNAEAAVLAEVQSDVLMFPDQPHGWRRLADLGGDENASLMALNTALKHVTRNNGFEAQDLSLAFSGTGLIGHAQKAVFLAPWNEKGWDTFGGVIA